MKTPMLKAFCLVFMVATLGQFHVLLSFSKFFWLKFFDFIFWQRAVLAGAPDIIISTPACLAMCIVEKILRSSTLQESLSTLVLDEVFFTL